MRKLAVFAVMVLLLAIACQKKTDSPSAPEEATMVPDVTFTVTQTATEVASPALTVTVTNTRTVTSTMTITMTSTRTSTVTYSAQFKCDAMPTPPTPVYCSVRDTQLYEGFPDLNYGGSITDLNVFGGTSNVTRAIFYFDISSIPADATVKSARLILTVKAAPGSVLGLQMLKLTRDWTEGIGSPPPLQTPPPSGASWNYATSSQTWTNPGGDFSTDMTLSNTVVGGIYQNVTIAVNDLSVVQEWISTPALNYGVLLRSANESSSDGVIFYSREESETARRPKFEVDYTLP